MNADAPVVLDTCVLVPVSLCDTLLRLAERHLFIPRWSSETRIELERALVTKIGLTTEKAKKRIAKMHEHFGDAVVRGYEPLLPSMTNQEKDRHVLAAAAESEAELIVTLNLRDFPQAALTPFGVEAKHPDAFLISLYDLSPQIVTHTLNAQASAIGRSLPDLLGTLRRVTPDFAELIRSQLQL
jgi:predicted nucleic acid-binding protein